MWKCDKDMHDIMRDSEQYDYNIYIYHSWSRRNLESMNKASDTKKKMHPGHGLSRSSTVSYIVHPKPGHVLHSARGPGLQRALQRRPRVAKCPARLPNSEKKQLHKHPRISTWIINLT